MAKKQHKANLFQFTVYLKQDGNIEINMDGVQPEQLEAVINTGMPQYDGAHSIASLLRYIRSMGNEMLDKSRNYI